MPAVVCLSEDSGRLGAVGDVTAAQAPDSRSLLQFARRPCCATEVVDRSVLVETVWMGPSKLVHAP